MTGHGASHPLDELWATVLERADADPETSWTARLLSRGIGRIAQKVGEEGVETAIAAVRLESGTGTTAELAAESADLLYHLTVLWRAAGLTPEDVYAALQSRRGRSGIEEKAGRADGASTIA